MDTAGEMLEIPHFMNLQGTRLEKHHSFKGHFPMVLVLPQNFRAHNQQENNTSLNVALIFKL